MKVRVCTTVARHDVHQLAGIAALVGQEGALTWSGVLLVPTGRGADLGSLTAQDQRRHVRGGPAVRLVPGTFPYAEEAGAVPT